MDMMFEGMGVLVEWGLVGVLNDMDGRDGWVGEEKKVVVG